MPTPNGAGYIESAFLARCMAFHMAGNDDETALPRSLREAMESDEEILSVSAMRAASSHILYKSFPQGKDRQFSIGGKRADLLRKMEAKVIGQAEAEGTLWTPGTDALWNMAPEENEPPLEEYRQDLWQAGNEMKTRLENRARMAAEGVHASDVSEAITRLSGVQAACMWHQVGRHMEKADSRALEEAAAAEVDEEIMKSLFTGILLNERFGEDAIYAALLRHTGIRRPHLAAPAALLYETYSVALMERFGGMRSDVATQILKSAPEKFGATEELAAARKDAEPDVLETIWAGDDDRARAITLLNPQMEGKRHKMLSGLSGHSGKATFSRIAEHKAITPDVIEWFKLNAHNSWIPESAYYRLVLNDSVSDEQAVEIALSRPPARGTADILDIRKALIQRDGTRNDPRLQKLLLGSSAQGVAESLLRNTEKSDVLEKALMNLLARGKDADRRRTLQILVNRQIPEGLHLSRRALLEMLGSANSELKTLAMEVLARWTQAGAVTGDARKDTKTR